jgi:hypothetical protein
MEKIILLAAVISAVLVMAQFPDQPHVRRPLRRSLDTRFRPVKSKLDHEGQNWLVFFLSRK